MPNDNTNNIVNNIVPSKPFKSFAEIASLASVAKDRVERIQVDICDGVYVKNVSWPFTETSKNDFVALAQKPDLDVFMPECYDLNYTADMMCENPIQYIDTLAQYGFDEIIIHFRSIEKYSPLDKGGLERINDLCQKYQIKLYLAVDVKTDLEEFLQVLTNSDIAGVQIMGIENIGLQGQEFAPHSLEIVKTIKKQFPNLKVLFDGGIDEENLEIIVNAGVDVFCLGHLLTDGNFADNLRFIKKVIH